MKKLRDGKLLCWISTLPKCAKSFRKRAYLTPKEGVSDPDPASNGTADMMIHVLEDFKDDASYGGIS